MAKVPLLRMRAGEGRSEENEADSRLGQVQRRGGWREGNPGVNLSKRFVSDRLQQEQTNGFTLAFANKEIRREIGGHKLEQVEAGSSLIHGRSPCQPVRWRAPSSTAQLLLRGLRSHLTPMLGLEAGRGKEKHAPPLPAGVKEEEAAAEVRGHPCSSPGTPINPLQPMQGPL